MYTVRAEEENYATVSQHREIQADRVNLRINQI
jgi:hypothetical protein